MFGGKKFVFSKNILILIFVMVCLCGCGKKEDTSKYEYGSYDNIEDEFEILSNTHSQVCVAGGFDRVVVDYAETSGGVKVAWKNGLYVSVKNDEKVTSIVLCSEFATHYGYIQPTKY